MLVNFGSTNCLSERQILKKELTSVTELVELMFDTQLVGNFGCQIVWEAGATGVIELQTSIDGENFTTLDFSNCGHTFTFEDPDTNLIFDISDTSMRYWKINLNVLTGDIPITVTLYGKEKQGR